MSPSKVVHIPQQDLIKSYAEKKRSGRREMARLQRVTMLCEILAPAVAAVNQLQHSL